MASVIKTWDFLTTNDGLADVALSALMTAAWLASDGDPSNGCLQFIQSAGAAGVTEKARTNTADTWETWGVPVGATVTSVQLTLKRRFVWPAPPADGDATITFRLVDGAAAAIAASDLYTFTTAIAVGWTGAAGSVVAITAGKGDSGDAARMEVEVNNTTSLSGADVRCDTLSLEIFYSTPAPTSFTLTPASQTINPGAVSSTLTITLDSPAVSAESFSLSDGGSGAGVFMPPSPVTVPIGATTVTFAYLNPAAGLYTITATALTTTSMGAETALVLVKKEVPGFEVRVYNGDGLRMSVPVVVNVWFEVLERGGYGQGGVTFLATWEELSFVGGERVDVYYGLTLIPVYRGYVRIPEKTVDGSGETVDLGLYGLMERLAGYQVSRRYIKPMKVDISELFQEIITDYVTTAARLPSLDLDINVVGVNAQQYDGNGQNVSESFDGLCDMAPNMAVWGLRLTAAKVDQLFIEPRSASIAYRFSVRGGEVGVLRYSEDTSRIVNRAFVRGGRVTQPNLVRNGSFEEPLPLSETAGNKLGDYSFEAGSGGATLAGGATLKTAGDIGGARTGVDWLEMDAAGEMATWTVAINYLVPLIAGGYWRREQVGNANAARITVVGLDAGSSPVGGATVTIPAAGYTDPGGVSYVNYEDEVDFSAFATVTQARFRVEVNAGTSSNDGIDGDDFYLYEAEGVWASGWTYLESGCTRDELNWLVKVLPAVDTAPYHGGYAVLAKAAGVAGADYLQLYTSEDARISVRGGQSYSVGFMLRGESATTPTDDVEFTFGLIQYKADGTVTATSESATQGPAAYAAWIFVGQTWTLATDCVQVAIFIRLRNNNRHYIDAVGLYEGNQPREIGLGAGGYWAGDTYERVMDVENALLVDLDAGVSDSINDYGEREARLSQESVTDEESLIAYLTGYFNAHGLPIVESDIELTDPKELVAPTGTVKLLNLPNAPAALFPTRMRTTFPESGEVRQEVNLGNERPDLTNLLLYLDKKGKK